MAQYKHGYAICCRLEVDNDVIPGRNLINNQRYARENLKMLALVLSEILPKAHFVTLKSVTAAVT